MTESEFAALLETFDKDFVRRGVSSGNLGFMVGHSKQLAHELFKENRYEVRDIWEMVDGMYEAEMEENRIRKAEEVGGETDDSARLARDGYGKVEDEDE